MLNESIDKPFFKLHANCIPVKGASRSLICDVQRGKYDFITNDLYEILINQAEMPIKNIWAFYGDENHEILEEYFNFLSREEYIFFCEFYELALFPKLNLQWENPSAITNAIIDIDGDSRHSFPAIFRELEDLGCGALQLRFFSQMTLEEVSDILMLLKSSSITSIEIIMPHVEVSIDELVAFAKSHLRIEILIFHSATETRTIEHESLPRTYIMSTVEKINDESHCGAVSVNYFAINIESFTEAQSHNSCLNRKISIDKFGNIKNCPSMSISHGHTNSHSLSEVIKMPEFTKLWTLNKDQIEICKDCEFRYICTDCRAFTLNNGTHSKPAKCNYNPYTEIWEERLN